MVPRDYTLNVVVKNQANKPVKNAAVLVKEGDATIATLTTDTQGKAAKAGTFNDDNEHIFTIAVTPPETTKENILPTQDFVSITSASTRNVTITCPADKKAPVPSQISITQVGKTALQVSFKLDDEKGNSSVEYQNPQGLIKKTPWKTGMSSPGSGMSDHTVLVQGSAMKPGTYKIKVKSKDKWNNIGESEVREFQLFGESLWDFKIASQAASGITFTWKKYPHSEKFGKYTITIGTQAPIEIADINTTTYTLTNYASTAVRQVKLTARASDGTGILASGHRFITSCCGCYNNYYCCCQIATTTAATTTAATTTAATTTTAQQTQQGEQTTGGETQTQQTQQTGQGTQTDANQAGGTTQTNQAGAGSSSQTQQEQGQLVQEKTLLKFVDKPMKAYANKEVSFKMAVQTQKSKKIAATCILDWGDGKKDEADTGVPFKHIYQGAGKYKISATASLKESGVFSLPQPISADITVSVMPPKIALTKSTPKGGVPGYDFMIKAEEGSYPIVKWTLSFGDGSNESGEGKVSKSFNHVYSSEGSYKVEFSVTDTYRRNDQEVAEFKDCAEETVAVKLRQKKEQGINRIESANKKGESVETKDLGKTSTGMQANIAGLLSYILGWITGLIFFLIEKENKFVRFHAMQSMIIFGALFILQIVVWMFMMILAMMRLGVLIPLFSLVNGFVMLLGLVLWVVLMIKAYQGEKFKLPVIGDIAEKNIEK